MYFKVSQIADVKQMNITTCPQSSWVDLILTEQRIQHLAILRIDEKMNRILSTNNDLKSDASTEIIR